MQKRFITHLSLIAVSVGALLYIAQNCGEDHQDLRTRGPDGDAATETAQENADQAAEDPMRELQLTIGIEGDTENANGLNLLALPTVSAFSALLYCGSNPPDAVNSSPILVSANASCVVGLTEIDFGGAEGKYQVSVAPLRPQLAAGAKYLMINSRGEIITILIESQFSLIDTEAKATFRFFQTDKQKVTSNAKIKEIVVDGQLAPDIRVIGSPEISTSNAGVAVRTTFRCNGNFRAGDRGSFQCNDFSSTDLNLVFEPLAKALNFDAIESESPDSIDGPKGLFAQLAVASKPLASFGPVLTADGFTITTLLKDTNSGRFAGVPEQVLIGVGTAQGGVATTQVTIDIR